MDDLQARLSKAFSDAPEEQREVFHRLASGGPDAVTDADLEKIAPLLDAMKAQLPAPTRTTTPPVFMDLTGYLFPHRGSEGDLVKPAFLGLGNSNALYLPCFSSIEKLRETMAAAGSSYAGVKQIDDGLEFLSELPRELDGHPVKIMCDPYKTEDGAIRYVEIPLD